MKIFNPNQLTTKPFYIRNKIILSPGGRLQHKIVEFKAGVWLDYIENDQVVSTAEWKRITDLNILGTILLQT